MKLSVVMETVSMAEPVAVSRGSYPDAEIIVATLERGGRTGRGEGCPLAHYGQSAGQCIADIEALRADIESGVLNRAALQSAMPPGPARNALDCALWDLEAALEGTSVWDLSGRKRPPSVATAMTISLGSPDAMADKASALTQFATIKAKLSATQPLEAISAIRQARPDARLSIDVNEGWDRATLASYLDALADADVAMIEQPLPEGDDADLAGMPRALLCADESFRHIGHVDRIAPHFGYANIKLDKCGGLTEALAICERLADHDVKPMVGCMFGTSLAIAPAMIVASQCDFADLDGPLHLAGDRPDGFVLRDGAWLTGNGIWGSV